MLYFPNQRTLLCFVNQFPEPLLDRDLQLRQIIPFKGSPLSLSLPQITLVVETE